MKQFLKDHWTAILVGIMAGIVPSIINFHVPEWQAFMVMISIITAYWIGAERGQNDRR